jgi:hypothetical protein
VFGTMCYLCLRAAHHSKYAAVLTFPLFGIFLEKPICQLWGQVCELAGDQENAIADYQKALSKKNPALTPKRKANAQARIRELYNHSRLSVRFERYVRRTLEPIDKVRDSRAKSRRTCQAVANEPYVLRAKAAAESVGSSSRAAHISAR